VLEEKPEQINPQVAGLFTMGRELRPNSEEMEALLQMEDSYWQGHLQFSQLKTIVAEITARFVGEFQLEKRRWEEKPELVEKILEKGTEMAKQRISETIELVHEAIGTSLRLSS